MLGRLEFYDFLWTACRETESNKHSILGGFLLFPQATLLIRRRFTRASLLTDLYLEWSYEDLLYIRNKANMPEEKQIGISSTFFLSCKQ